MVPEANEQMSKFESVQAVQPMNCFAHLFLADSEFFSFAPWIWALR